MTDRQTDGIAIASTALAMRALRRAVKTKMFTVTEKYVRYTNMYNTAGGVILHIDTRTHLTHYLTWTTSVIGNNKHS